MFSTIKLAVSKQFDRMKAYPLFRVDVEKDLLWQTYLKSFPQGTNPLLKERSEHDCNYCKNFIRSVGGVVAIIDGKLESIWDVKVDNFYQEVADALSILVKSKPIDNIFLHTEPIVGVDVNRQQTTEGIITYHHFYYKLPTANVVKGVDIGPRLSVSRSSKDVFLRSLQELTLDSIDTVLELISQNSLYRGEENKFALETFHKVKVEFEKSENKDLFAWANLSTTSDSVLKMRNTAIGTLLEDISEGRDLEASVKSFEAKVAPANYKRPTAPVTKAMVEKARTTITELGFTSALERRFATIKDITINNILFADRNAKKAMAGDVFDLIAGDEKINLKSLEKVESVSIEVFINDILPKATSIELMVENRHASNLVSLIAPVHPDSKSMFKWDNNFSWSYAGEMADSYIKAEVQARGGRVDGVFRFSHSWNHEKRNASLMDLYVFLPGSTGKPIGSHDDYGNYERVNWNHRKHPKSWGVQDVDYTEAAPVGFIPVENITFPSLEKMLGGDYICAIHNWQLRSPTQGGFRAEVEFGGEVFQYEFDRPLKDKEWVKVATVNLDKKSGIFSIKHHIPAGSSAKDMWGVSSQSFHKASVVMMSPNHWDGKPVGNKHYFFMLEGCLNDGKARGFFNEFLSEELTSHRKTMEIVGAKMKTEESQNQLSGLGFSSTQRSHVYCRVKGSFSRVVKVVF